jgi:superfamily II DNA helicase RecQ
MDFNAILNECVKSLPFIDRLKDQQRLAIVSLLQGKDVVCILPTGFGKSLIFQLYILTKLKIKETVPCILIISPLKSVVEDQIKELSKFGLSAIALAQVLDERTKHDIYNINASTSIIIGSAEEFLNGEFIIILKDRDSQLYQRLSLVVVDECHTVDTW